MKQRECVKSYLFVVFREVDIFKVSTFFLPEVLRISPNNKVVSFPLSSFSLCICVRESPVKGWVFMVMSSLILSKHQEYSQQVSLAKAEHSDVVSRPASSTAPRSWSEMQVLRFYLRPSESATVRMTQLFVF